MVKSMVAIGFSLFVACSPALQWAKKDVASGESKSQQAACELDAERSLGFSSGIDTEARRAQVDRLASLCMKAQGYTLEASAN